MGCWGAEMEAREASWRVSAVGVPGEMDQDGAMRMETSGRTSHVSERAVGLTVAPKKICPYPKLVNVTMFGKRIFGV